MKRTLARLLLYLSALGLILPQAPLATAANLSDNAPKAAAASPLVDVALKGGLLRGQLVDGKGAAKALTQVTISTKEQVVERAVSDEQGRFALRLNQSGVYFISAGDNSSLIRAWTEAAAPPSAKEAILLVSDQGTQRGQKDCCDPCCDPGRPYLKAALAVAAIGGITTAIIIAVQDDGS